MEKAEIKGVGWMKRQKKIRFFLILFFYGIAQLSMLLMDMGHLRAMTEQLRDCGINALLYHFIIQILFKLLFKNRNFYKRQIVCFQK